MRVGLVIYTRSQEAFVRSTWSWVTGSCEPHCVDAKKDPLEEQYMLLSTEPSLQPLPFLLSPFDSSYSLMNNPSLKDRLPYTRCMSCARNFCVP